jgi:hypothetical protein
MSLIFVFGQQNTGGTIPRVAIWPRPYVLNVIVGGVFLSQTWDDFSMLEFGATTLRFLSPSPATLVSVNITPTADKQNGGGSPTGLPV